MKATDLDWREIMNSWSADDIRYLRSICDEKLSQIETGVLKRKALIRR